MFVSILYGKIYTNNVWVVCCMLSKDIILRKHITCILRHSKKVVNKNGWVSIYRLTNILGKPIKEVRNFVKSDAERYEYSSRLNRVRAKKGHTNGYR